MPKEPESTEAPATASAPSPSPARGGRVGASAPTAPAVAEFAPGTVVKDDGDYEEVVVRRKKAARPTGRYLSIANYRFSVDDEKVAKALEKQGAKVSRHRYDKDHELAGQTTFHVYLPPPTDNAPAPSFDLPPNIAEHALAVGAVTEELR